jgi:hypothetical protein
VLRNSAETLIARVQLGDGLVFSIGAKEQPAKPDLEIRLQYGGRACDRSLPQAAFRASIGVS